MLEKEKKREKRKGRMPFPVGVSCQRVKSDLKTVLNPMELIDRGEDIASFVTLTLQYLCVKLLDLAGNAAIARSGSSEMMPSQSH